MSSGTREKETAGNNDFPELILFTVATQERCDILDLPPLSQTIDQEGLELILERGIVDRVTFSYLGYEVTVTPEEEVEITEATTSEETRSQ